MHARVSTYTGLAAERLEEGVRAFQQTTDALQQLDGFEGAYLLTDAAGGRVITVTLWSSSEAEQASAERAAQVRADAADAAGIAIESVRTYEVAMHVRATG